MAEIKDPENTIIMTHKDGDVEHGNAANNL